MHKQAGKGAESGEAQQTCKWREQEEMMKGSFEGTIAAAEITAELRSLLGCTAGVLQGGGKVK